MMIETLIEPCLETWTEVRLGGSPRDLMTTMLVEGAGVTITPRVYPSTPRELFLMQPIPAVMIIPPGEMGFAHLKDTERLKSHVVTDGLLICADMALVGKTWTGIDAVPLTAEWTAAACNHSLTPLTHMTTTALNLAPTLTRVAQYTRTVVGGRAELALVCLTRTWIGDQVRLLAPRGALTQVIMSEAAIKQGTIRMQDRLVSMARKQCVSQAAQSEVRAKLTRFLHRTCADL